VTKILLLGGTGFVGRHVCEKLARLQWRVTVPTRRGATAQHLQVLPLVDVVQADVHDEATLTRLVAGHDAVVNLVAILHGKQADFERTHVELPAKLARACLAAGVKRVVHVSALGADPLHPETAPSMYLRSKSQGEAVLQRAASEGLQLSVLRPSVIFGAEDKFLNLFASLQRMFVVMPLAAGSARFQPVWVEDVAQAIVRCLQDRTTIGQTYELCGPDVRTLKELVQLAGRTVGANHGRGHPIIPLPQVLGRLQAWLLELAPGKPLMSRDNLDSMRIDNVASGQRPGLSALGITPGALAAIVPTYLGRQSTQGSPTRFVGLRGKLIRP
jgi:NADH dehydrogenase